MIYQIHTGDFIDLSKIVSISKPFVKVIKGTINVGFSIHFQLMKDPVEYFRRMDETEEDSTLNSMHGPILRLTNGKIWQAKDKKTPLEEFVFYHEELKNIKVIIDAWKSYKENLNTTTP